MELREAFEVADTDKGGALELEEVSLSSLIPVHRSFWRYCGQKYEQKGVAAVVYEDRC
jgi:hypothetical protein